jgi:hypothetical protein
LPCVMQASLWSTNLLFPCGSGGARSRPIQGDILVEGRVLLELKSARVLEATHEAQLLHYLKSTEIEIGLLLNFGSSPQFRRLVFDNERKKIRGNQCKFVAKVSA